jgi:release factor glutamine methyltransferase
MRLETGDVSKPVEIEAPAAETAPGRTNDWLDWATSELAAHSDSARADAEVLLASALGCKRSQLRLRADDTLEAATMLRFVGWIERRKLGEPVAYITARCGFWSLELVVDTSVLIPRPDTETLVEWALQRLPVDVAVSVLDLGTGSGVIALSIAKERPLARVTATDVSTAALEVAAENAKLNGIDSVHFIQAEWFTALDEQEGIVPFDLIVSNPPYIAEGDAHLAALRYEPRLALTSGADGLDAIRHIVAHAGAHLVSGGALLLEHGADQGAAVRQLLNSTGFAAVETRCDFGGNERVTMGVAP